jgi:hypothetical protein
MQDCMPMKITRNPRKAGLLAAFSVAAIAALMAAPVTAQRSERQAVDRPGAERPNIDRSHVDRGVPARDMREREGLGGMMPRRDRAPAYSQRPVSDQDHAIQRRDTGVIRPLGELHRNAQTVGRGEYLGVEPDIQRGIYRFKFLRPSGKVVWVDVDGRTGRVVAERP